MASILSLSLGDSQQVRLLLAVTLKQPKVPGVPHYLQWVDSLREADD